MQNPLKDTNFLSVHVYVYNYVLSIGLNAEMQIPWRVFMGHVRNQKLMMRQLYTDN